MTFFLLHVDADFPQMLQWPAVSHSGLLVVWVTFSVLAVVVVVVFGQPFLSSFSLALIFLAVELSGPPFWPSFPLAVLAAVNFGPLVWSSFQLLSSLGLLLPLILP